MPSSVTYSEVKRDEKGKLKIVQHKTGSKVSVANGEAEGKSKNGNGGVTKQAGAVKDEAGAPTANGKPNDGEFTAEFDAKLKQMKAEGKTWREIAEALGRSPSTLKSRYKEIKDDGAPADAKPEKKAASPPKKDEREAPKDKAPPPKEKKADDSPGGQNDKDKAKSRGGPPKFTLREWMTLQEDDIFSMEELFLLTELILSDQEHFWIRIASRLFDQTGRRVHPDDIKDKFGEMGITKDP